MLNADTAGTAAGNIFWWPGRGPEPELPWAGGAGRRKVGRGPRWRTGLPGLGAPTGAAVPGPGWPGSGGGRPAPFVRVFQAGRLPPFPLPEFSFSVGEAPAQLEGEGVGEGVPGAGCPWPLWPDTPSLRHPLPRPGPTLTTSCPERARRPLGPGEEKQAWDPPGPAGAAALSSAPSDWLWVGLGAGCQGYYSALGCFAWVLSSASC